MFSLFLANDPRRSKRTYQRKRMQGSIVHPLHSAVSMCAFGEYDGKTGRGMDMLAIRLASAFARILAGAMIAFLLVFASTDPLWAQGSPPTAQPQKIEDLLKLLGDPEVQKWLETQKTA